METHPLSFRRLLVLSFFMAPNGYNSSLLPLCATIYAPTSPRLLTSYSAVFRRLLMSHPRPSKPLCPCLDLRAIFIHDSGTASFPRVFLLGFTVQPATPRLARRGFLLPPCPRTVPCPRSPARGGRRAASSAEPGHPRHPPRRLKSISGRQFKLPPPAAWALILVILLSFPAANKNFSESALCIPSDQHRARA